MKNHHFDESSTLGDQCIQSMHSVKSRIWLIFSLYYFAPMLYMAFEVVTFSLLILIYLVFLALYELAIRSNAHNAWRPILGLILLSVVAAPLTPGSGTFFSYIGFLLGFFCRTKQWLIFTGLLIGLITTLQLLINYPFVYFAFGAITGLVTIGIVGFTERVRYDSRISQQKSHEEIEQLAVIAERERIARDLHDILGHTLSSIALKAELAEKLLKQEKHESVQQHLSELHQIARNSLSLVRQTVSGYKHRGLSGEVMELCEKLRQSGFIVDLNGEIPQLTPRAETALILALTELTTNILRHSKGDRCHIEFGKSNDKVLVTMRDNGDVKSLTPGNGLHGIQERLQSLAGELQSSINKGCEFIISLPSRELHQQGS